MSDTWCGQPAITMRGDGELQVVVLPGRGGKIASLVDSSGHEWLEQPDGSLPDFALVTESFVDGDMCGWDECAPTIDECMVDSRHYPDHGDLWVVSWRPGEDGWVEGASPLGYRLARRVTVVDGAVRLDYRATSSRPMPFLWAAHPQFRAIPGSYVRLPADVRTLVDVEDPALTGYPASVQTTSLDQVPPGGSRKLYPDPESAVGAAALVRPDGRELVMSWDSSVAPYVGLWYDRGTHSRNDVIAIEPATGFFDSCAAAQDSGRVTTLEPGHPLVWWVELRFVTGQPPGSTSGAAGKLKCCSIGPDSSGQ